MFVQCIGSGDAFGAGGRFNSAYYVKCAKTKLLLDCGGTTLVGLKKFKIPVDDLDAVLISHLHGDHFGGLPFILCELLVSGKRKKPLTIIGPVDTEARTKEALNCFYPGIAIKRNSPVKFLTYVAKEVLEFNSVKITPYPAIHSDKTNPHCVRIEGDGKVLAYSGDSGWTDNLLTISANANLFICEGSFYEVPFKQHINIKELLRKVDQITAAKIVITHVGEEVLRNIKQVPLTIAEDGMILMDE